MNQNFLLITKVEELEFVQYAGVTRMRICVRCRKLTVNISCNTCQDNLGFFLLTAPIAPTVDESPVEAEYVTKEASTSTNLVVTTK